jgi:anti-sigma regulatory factor (Ser/Thr protein kinase)
MMITALKCPRCGASVEYFETKRYHKICLAAEEGFRFAVQHGITPNPQYLRTWVKEKLYKGKWAPPVGVIMSFLDQISGVHCKCLREES